MPYIHKIVNKSHLSLVQINPKKKSFYGWKIFLFREMDLDLKIDWYFLKFLAGFIRIDLLYYAIMQSSDQAFKQFNGLGGGVGI